MNPIDQHKLQFVLKDCILKLQFIGEITRDNDISSELAGYEQSKLLTDQQTLEVKYAELVAKRSTLVGISNRKQLTETQKHIQEVAQRLKESTKKLCRLFKENPNIDQDSLKVYEERAGLISDLENLKTFIQNNQLNKFAQNVTNSLEEQDSLRKFAVREKELAAEIKKLQNDKTQEIKEHEHEKTEKQKNIQSLKEKLLYKTNRADLKKKYDEKVGTSKENTQMRVFEFALKDIEQQILNFNTKIETEEKVHKQLKDYLIRKEEESKKKTDDQNKYMDEKKQELEDKIEKLTEQKNIMLKELDELNRRFEKEELEKQERERKEIQEQEAKKLRELQQLRMENAIKLIQNELMERKELYGLGAKKKKPKKTKK
ncbi:unnamed protein product [Paramecium pentaurelia]|uniref:Dynein regulatory complex protein 9 n=1 Tax=Paramecium pentaurelia TaxID=43138 RepID=A0A8S1U5V1_9CILI|nr:unnamed protein product [Paramecium pentaurelia]